MSSVLSKVAASRFLAKPTGTSFEATLPTGASRLENSSLLMHDAISPPKPAVK